jgi:hypothetical protein
MISRRAFIGSLAGGLLATPLAVRAQQVGKVYRIGILETIPAARNAANLDALRKGLRDLGYVEGRNLVAQEHFTTATTMFREMGMQFWLEQAEAELKELE